MVNVGKRIYSVCYGYIVTFRVIDPLYAIGSSNPCDEKVLSELKT